VARGQNPNLDRSMWIHAIISTQNLANYPFAATAHVSRPRIDDLSMGVRLLLLKMMAWHEDIVYENVENVSQVAATEALDGTFGSIESGD